MHGNVQHLNPAGLHKNPAYTQAVVVSGNATNIWQVSTTPAFGKEGAKAPS
jgi:hypothetical protein